MVNMNDSELWAQGSRCYEQLKVMDDMNSLGSYEMRPLDAMNNLGIRMIWMILSHEPMSLNVMNNLGLWMIWMTLGHDLKALDAMNNSELGMIWMTQDLVILDL